jgi:hypothetical protein
MRDQNVVVDRKWFLNQVGDGMYSFFEPLRALFRYLFGQKHYRVTYRYANGMTSSERSRIFTADHDRAARRHAKEIAGETAFSIKLERYREVKIP